MTPTSHSCVSKVPLFATLGPRQQLEVARFANAVSRKAGETLQAPGDADPVLMVVHTGAVRVSRIVADGQEQLVRLLEPGDFSGEIAFVTGRPSGQHLVAETDVEVCQFRHRDLSHERGPSFHDELNVKAQCLALPFGGDSKKNWLFRLDHDS